MQTRFSDSDSVIGWITLLGIPKNHLGQENQLSKLCIWTLKIRCFFLNVGFVRMWWTTSATSVDRRRWNVFQSFGPGSPHMNACKEVIIPFHFLVPAQWLASLWEIFNWLQKDSICPGGISALLLPDTVPFFIKFFGGVYFVRLLESLWERIVLRCSLTCFFTDMKVNF